MLLSMQSQVLESVVVIRCKGRIIAGDEIEALQLEIDKLVHLKKRIVLQMAEVTYVDSAGLGALVRLFSVLRLGGGGLKLCALSPLVLKVLQVSNLDKVIPTYTSEKEAVDAFSGRPEPVEKISHQSATTIVCIDSSPDVLAYLNALLVGAGYQVFTTRHVNDARTLVSAIKPRIVILGRGAQGNESLMEKIRRSVADAQVLPLPPDFSTSDASEAGAELVSRVRSVQG